MLTVLAFLVVAGTLTATLWTQTDKLDFDQGVALNVSTSSFPGDIVLSSAAQDSWDEPVVSGAPAGRKFHAAHYDSTGGTFIVFGGEIAGPAYADEMYSFEPSIGLWTLLDNPATRPSARSRFASGYSSYLDGIVVFGGIDAGGLPLADIWVYSVKDNLWSQVFTDSAPAARQDSAMVYLASEGKFLLYGGNDGALALSDTWIYDEVANSWTQVATASSPGILRNFSLCYIGSGKALLFGGTDGTTVSDGTWEFDYASGDWAELAPATSPEAAESAAMAFDEDLGVVVLYGGVVSGLPSEGTYSFDTVSGEWSVKAPASTPGVLYGHAMAYCRAMGRTYLLGGDTGAGLSAGLWTYSAKEFVSSGTFVSKVFDASYSSYWTESSWSETLFPGTDIIVKVRTTDNQSSWTDWGSVSTMEDASGNAINQKARYAQYRLELSTVSQDVTPYLNSISLDYTDVPSLIITSSADFASGQLSSMSVETVPGAIELARESGNFVIVADGASPSEIDISSWSGSAWETQEMASFGSAIDSFVTCDADGDGLRETYVLSAGFIYRISEEASGWTAKPINYTSSAWGLASGDGDNDGEVELYVGCLVDAAENLFQIKHVNSSWVRSLVASHPKAVWGIEVGDADNDGSNEVYFQSSDKKIYRASYFSAWDVTMVAFSEETVGRAQAFAIGDGDNDGSNEIFAVTTGPAFTVYRFFWTGGFWGLESLGDLGANGPIAVGDADNDGLNEVVAGAADPDDIVVFDKSGASWTMTTACSTSVSPVVMLAVKDVDNDSANEICAVDGGDSFLVTRLSGSWATSLASPDAKNWTVLEAGSPAGGGNGFVSSGSFVSAVLDAGKTVCWYEISWEQNTPDGTTMAIQTRTGGTPVPDSSWSDWSASYTDYVSSPVTSEYYRYLQVKASFATTDPAVSPKLFSIGLTFTTPPNAPVNSSPLDNETVTSDLATLQASSFSDDDPDEYQTASQWLIRTEDAGYGGLGSWNSGTDTSNLVSVVVPDGTLVLDTVYLWKVRYRDSRMGWSDYSAETSFRFYPAQGGSQGVGEAPLAPINWSPIDGSVLASLSPQITGSAFSDTDSSDYQVAAQWQIRTNYGDFDSPIFDSGTTTVSLTSIALPSGTLFDGQIYYWHVRYQDNNGLWSGYSNETSFVIDMAAGSDALEGKPTTPELVSPYIGSVVSDSVSLIWTASDSDSDVMYELQVATDPGFVGMVKHNMGLAVTEQLLTGLNNDLTFYWRVRARNPFGYSEWTETGWFMTPSQQSSGAGGCFLESLR